ncbi:MAG: HAD-superfamily hydrolase subfamily [Acidimicrobiales bacterium]|nr:HAD-superfamily hydrolase subfamily [Acidimicrobiales bacterium]
MSARPAGARPMTERAVSDPARGQLPVDVVVPTIGRPSLVRLLRSLACADGPGVRRVVLVDDRRDRRPSLLGPGLDPAAVVRGTWLAGRLQLVTGRARGPAAARNDGWRAATAEWVAFLDDDVVVPTDWLIGLGRDLAPLDRQVAGSEGRIVVPLPADRAPTDWERNVAGLEVARWATADLACRRIVLAAVGGFDERFPRAYREDADLGLRITGAGWQIVAGRRHVVHPVPPARWSVSLANQAGNADDALTDRLHGPGWRARAGAPAGRRRLHVATSAAVLAAVVAGLAGRRRTAALAAACWSVLTADFLACRLVPGPLTAPEVVKVGVTTVLLPPVASAHWLRGWFRSRRHEPSTPCATVVEAVLFDRDGTLVEDVPHNRDPELVSPVPGAAQALDRLRAAGVRVGIVSNQGGVAGGLVGREQVEAVHRRIEDVLGPFDVVRWCPHDDATGCGCRKPAPGLVLQAAADLAIPPHRVAVVGDIGSDVAAARAAGALGVLVPTVATRFEEVADCPAVFAHLGAVVDQLLHEPAVRP